MTIVLSISKVVNHHYKCTTVYQGGLKFRIKLIVVDNPNICLNVTDIVIYVINVNNSKAAALKCIV